MIALESWAGWKVIPANYLFLVNTEQIGLGAAVHPGQIFQCYIKNPKHLGRCNVLRYFRYPGKKLLDNILKKPKDIKEGQVWSAVSKGETKSRELFIFKGKNVYSKNLERRKQRCSLWLCSSPLRFLFGLFSPRKQPATPTHDKCLEETSIYLDPSHAQGMLDGPLHPTSTAVVYLTLALTTKFCCFLPNTWLEPGLGTLMIPAACLACR